MLELAKLVFAFAVGLNSGGSQHWPMMAVAQNTSPATLAQQIAIGDVWQGCPPVSVGQVSTCVPGFVSGYVIQYLCAATPGHYQLTARLGMVPLPTGSPRLEGALWLDGPEPLFIMAFAAEPDRWTTQGATHVIYIPSPSCMTFRYDFNGFAQVNPDTRATYFTFHRIGA